MKKLITILLATFFICTTSYGATIKELLKGKKSIRLSCLIDYYAYTLFVDPFTHKELPDWIGLKISIVVEDKLFKIDRKEYHLDETTHWITGDPIKRKILISDEFIKLKHIAYILGENRIKERDYDKVDITIDRYTGGFVWVERNWTTGADVRIVGECTKIEEKKI